jgi:tetratricopeptide (TPR) repeat protein
MIVIRGFFLALLACSLLARVCAAEEATEPAPGPPPPATNDATAEALNAYLQKQERSNLILQEKLQALESSLQETRDHSESASRRSSDALSTRLRMIEQTLTTQREREMEVMQKSNRFLLTVAGVFGCVGLCAMVFTAWFLLRAMNRLAEVAAALPALPAPSPLGLEGGHREVVALPPESNRLLGAIDRLEKRIHQLEHTSHTGDQSNGNSSANNLEIVVPAAGSQQERDDQFNILLAKGESLLNIDDAEKALACFNEAIRFRPGDPNTLVKKGTALERLKRWEEALQCYDQAIATDASLTLAYLYKGGVYNQLEKFSEALECYEQALRTQQKLPA